MKLAWCKVLIALLLPCISIYWIVAGHHLRYTINPGPGEYEEDFSTQGRIIISCFAGAFWAVAATILSVIVRRLYHAFFSLVSCKLWPN
jgi:hypothetical protein